MEKKKVDLGAVAAGAGRNAKAFFEKAKDSIVKAVDQNDDGSVDLKDVSAIAETIGNAAKNTAAVIKDSAESKSREMELKALRPIFLEDLDSTDFLLSKLIRVTDIDKRHAESDVCQGSIGYISEQKELRIVNIFRDSTGLFQESQYSEEPLHHSGGQLPEASLFSH